jgi:SHS2 domain-containing protein
LEFLDHTADAGILVQAADVKELFARAAWGMFSLVTDVDTVRLVERSRIRIKASDRPALMVNWLSELNYRHVTEHRLFGKFVTSKSVRSGFQPRSTAKALIRPAIRSSRK